MRCCGGALRDAVAADFADRNVAAMVKPPPMAFHEIQTLDVEQIRTFLAAAARDRWEALWLLAVTSGMRQGQLLGLRWSDVDLDRGVLHVTGNLWRGPNGLEVMRPKTHRSRRPIRLARQRSMRYDGTNPRKPPSGCRPDRLGGPPTGFLPVHRPPALRSLAGTPPIAATVEAAGLPLTRFHDPPHGRHALVSEWYQPKDRPRDAWSLQGRDNPRLVFPHDS